MSKIRPVDLESKMGTHFLTFFSEIFQKFIVKVFYCEKIKFGKKFSLKNSQEKHFGAEVKARPGPLQDEILWPLVACLNLSMRVWSEVSGCPYLNVRIIACCSGEHPDFWIFIQFVMEICDENEMMFIHLSVCPNVQIFSFNCHFNIMQYPVTISPFYKTVHFLTFCYLFPFY